MGSKITDLVTRCKMPDCDFVRVPKDKQEMVAALQLQEWGMLKDTKCESCGKIGTLAVETEKRNSCDFRLW